VIERILPRRSKFSRKAAGEEFEEQILAVNIDFIFLVTGLDGDYNLRRIERYLTLVSESGASPVIVLNKADLCPDLGPVLNDVRAIAAGTPVLVISALLGTAIDQLPAMLGKGETAALIGSSGAGKSTIVNRLLGREALPTSPVRESDSRGRHTTTHRELIPMPGGWWLMDTPGLREIQLWASPQALQSSFADVSQFAVHCRFRDCTHHNEPGCAVRDAIAPDRLQSFHKLQKELHHVERQTNIHAAQEEKRKWKSIHKAMRNFDKRV
jgi:ribosome biogenesis GTPase